MLAILYFTHSIVPLYHASDYDPRLALMDIGATGGDITAAFWCHLRLRLKIRINCKKKKKTNNIRPS